MPIPPGRSSGLSPGDPVQLAMTKWGDRPHWTFDGTYLGADEHGEWLGLTAGTTVSRPGLTMVTRVDLVTLVPAGVGWVATFYPPGFHLSTYVDMTSMPEREGGRWHAVDLDLDVVRLAEGDVYVDDEDEFAEHQVRYGYPPEVIALAEESCAWVLEEVLQERPPFDGATAGRWLARLAGPAAT